MHKVICTYITTYTLIQIMHNSTLQISCDKLLRDQHSASSRLVSQISKHITCKQAAPVAFLIPSTIRLSSRKKFQTLNRY